MNKLIVSLDTLLSVTVPVNATDEQIREAAVAVLLNQLDDLQFIVEETVGSSE